MDAAVSEERPAHWRTTKKQKPRKAQDPDGAVPHAPLPAQSPYQREYQAVLAAYGALLLATNDAREASLVAERAELGPGAGFVRLQPRHIVAIQQHYPLVSRPQQLHEELRGLFDNKKREFGFSPLFAPPLIDACCRNGVFPMSINVGTPVFAPKLHVRRAVADITPHTRLPGGARRSARGYSFLVDDGWGRVVEMIRAQHGEDWLCAPLRAAFRHMALHPTETATAVHSVAVIDNARFLAALAAEPAGQGDEQARSRAVAAAMVACELGFTVGTIYTSLTGAFDAAASGAGAVQMAALAGLLLELGFEQWDFGMMMDYKRDGFGARNIPRWEWVGNVRARRDRTPERLPALSPAILGPASGGAGLASTARQLLPCVALIDAFERRRPRPAEGPPAAA